jgi:hypothetical protein
LKEFLTGLDVLFAYQGRMEAKAVLKRARGRQCLWGIVCRLLYDGVDALLLKINFFPHLKSPILAPGQTPEERKKL